MMRVLVTGATGFVAQHSLSPLLQAGAHIHAVTRRSGLERAGITWHRCDLLQAEERTQLIEQVKPSHLLHFAWATEHGQFWEMAENDSWQQASRDLIQLFCRAGGQRVVVAGSCAEYDWQDPALAQGAPCDERTTPTRPATLYGRCKLSLLEWLRGQPGLSYGWGRIFFAYGPHEDRRRLVPSVILPLLAGQPARIGPGTQIRDFLDVRDIAAAFVALLLSPVEGVVNIGAGLGVSIAGLARAIAQTMGRPDLLLIGALPARATDPPYLIPSIKRLQDEVGFVPGLTQAAGVEQAIAWWRHHQ